MRWPDRVRIDRANRVIEEACNALSDRDRIQVGDVVTRLRDDLSAVRAPVGTVVRIDAVGIVYVAWGVAPHKTKWRVIEDRGQAHEVYQLKPIRASQVREHEDGIEVKA